MKDIIQVRINKSFWIEKSGHGFTLVEMVPGKDAKGNPKLQERLRYYGTVYQSLQGFLFVQVDESNSVDNVFKRVSSAMEDIRAAEKEIKETFCIEVRTTK